MSRLRDLAFLNKNTAINFKDLRNGREEKFHYEGGIIEFVQMINKNTGDAREAHLSDRGEGGHDRRGGHAVHRRLHGELLFTFVNNINTIEGGTHLAGFRSALTRTINNYALENKFIKEGAELSPARMSGRA